MLSPNQILDLERRAGKPTLVERLFLWPTKTKRSRKASLQGRRHFKEGVTSREAEASWETALHGRPNQSAWVVGCNSRPLFSFFRLQVVATFGLFWFQVRSSCHSADRRAGKCHSKSGYVGVAPTRNLASKATMRRSGYSLTLLMRVRAGLQGPSTFLARCPPMLRPWRLQSNCHRRYAPCSFSSLD